MKRLVEGRLGTAVLGLVFTALVLGLSSLGIAYGFGVFSHSTTVTADLPEAGPALGPGSEVEYRGVLVGSLGSLDRELTHAKLTLDLDPSQLHNIPAGVTVRLVPRSVFGDLYVDLVPPAHPTGHLQPGAVLAADTSTPTVELDQALDAGYQLLTAVQPSKLDQTLTAIATALNGRGAKLGALVAQASHYSAQVAPHTTQLIHDVTTLGTVGNQLSASSPSLFRVLTDSLALSKNIAAEQPTLTKVLAAGPGVADQTGALLADNRVRLRTLVHLLHPVIGILGAHTANLRTTVFQLQQFVNGAARALGHGPYLQVDVVPDTKLSQGDAYTAANCPRYPGLNGSNCPRGSHAAAASSGEIVQALVAQVAGAGSGSTSNPRALAALEQRIAIGDVLLAPALRSVGGLLR
jgi:phospholipid/cholesterol/gamma-HCH transport system substrate-binding protein